MTVFNQKGNVSMFYILFILKLYGDKNWTNCKISDEISNHGKLADKIELEQKQIVISHKRKTADEETKM
jgi:hypothetical protein